MLAKGSHLETYHFEGDEEMNTTFTAVAAVTSWPDQGSKQLQGKGVMDITASDHGYKRGDRADIPNHIFIKGSVYEYLATIVDDDSVDANSLFVNGVFSATDSGSLYPGLKFDEPWLLVGYSIHQSAAYTASENFVILKDAARGAAFDATIVTVPMNGVTDYCEMFENPWPIARNDIVYCTYANSGDKTWGLELYALRLR